MGIREADELSKTLFQQKGEYSALNKKLNEYKIKDKEKSNEEKILAQLAILRGEKYVAKDDGDNIGNIENSINEVKNKIDELEEKLLNDMGELKFDIPMVVPQIENNKSALVFEGGPYPDFIKFMASIIDSEDILKIDDVEMQDDKLVVYDVSKPEEVVEKLSNFIMNIKRLSSIKLNHVDPEVLEVVDTIYNLKNNEIWEATNGRSFSYARLYETFNIKDSNDKKNLRNFITNLEITLKEKYPFIKKGSGEFEFNFFGNLVWNGYVKKYGIDKKQVSDSDKKTESESKIEIKDQPKQESINGYISKDDKKILYGKAIKNGS